MVTELSPTQIRDFSIASSRKREIGGSGRAEFGAYINSNCLISFKFNSGLWAFLRVTLNLFSGCNCEKPEACDM